MCGKQPVDRFLYLLPVWAATHHALCYALNEMTFFIQLSEDLGFFKRTGHTQQQDATYRWERGFGLGAVKLILQVRIKQKVTIWDTRNVRSLL